ARRGPGLGREPELPLIAPQLEGEVQAQRGRSGLLGGAGRSGHRRLLSSSFWLNKVAGAYQQRPALLLPLHLHRISVEDGWRESSRTPGRAPACRTQFSGRSKEASLAPSCVPPLNVRPHAMWGFGGVPLLGATQA